MWCTLLLPLLLPSSSFFLLLPPSSSFFLRYDPGQDLVTTMDDAGCISCDPTAFYSDEIGFEPCKKKGGAGGLSCAKGYVK